MPSSSQPIELFSLLLKKSLDGNMNWERTNTDNEFRVNFPTGSVQIQERYDPEIEDTYLTVTIYNKEGIQVEEISAADLLEAYPQPYKEMRQLFELARRSALGADVVINGIISALKK